LDARELQKWTPEACSPPLKKEEGMAQAIMATLKEFLPENSLVLDLGCGIGRFVPLFTEWMNYRYVGVDQSPSMIKKALETYPQQKFICMNAMQLPFQNTFDLVFTCAVLQHNRHEDKDKILPKIHQSLKPEGLFLMIENTFTEQNYHYALGGGAPGYYPIPKETPFTANFTDGYSFTEEGWKKYISAFHFKLLRCNPHATLYLFKKT
jgi:ubiquinone/menaquinone biosynthesis C-methylase UbiE